MKWQRADGCRQSHSKSPHTLQLSRQHSCMSRRWEVCFSQPGGRGERSRPFVLQHHMKDLLICHRQVAEGGWVSCCKHGGDLRGYLRGFLHDLYMSVGRETLNKLSPRPRAVLCLFSCFHNRMFVCLVRKLLFPSVGYTWALCSQLISILHP